MDKKIEVIKIDAVDKYGECISDGMNKCKSPGTKPQGYVDIFEQSDDGSKKLLGRHNLVLYYGREWLAERIIDFNNSSVTPTKDEYICWFGLGDGGVSDSDPFTPVPPIITDDNLYSRVMINATDSSAADYQVASPPDYPETGYYKIPFDGKEFVTDDYNEYAWLIIKLTINVGLDDANGYQLSEAGLFTAESNAGGYGGPFNIFSRVTFPSIVKTTDRRLIFNWYLYV
jgi:hypothetical protein